MSSEPQEEPEDFMTRFEREWAERKQKAEERKQDGRKTAAYLCEALRFFGVQKVTAEWDGYGDDGQMEEAVFHPAPPADLPLGLRDAIDRLWDDFLPPGCEINAGSFGTLTIDVATGVVSDDIEYRDDDEMEEEDEEED